MPPIGYNESQIADNWANGRRRGETAALPTILVK
jgi:hypothetical protein